VSATVAGQDILGAIDALAHQVSIAAERLPQRASFHARVAAGLIDLMTLAITIHGCALIDVYLNENTGLNYIGMVTWSGFGAVTLLLMLLEVFQAATPGKRLMKLVIAGADGKPAPRPALLKRAFVKYAAALFLVFPVATLCAADPTAPWRLQEYVRGALFAMGAVDAVLVACIAIYTLLGCFRARKPDRPTFHDLAAGTAVYRRDNPPPRRGFAPVVDPAADTEEG
jgi:uncharacterized RDD family membrane protein YckC